MVSKEEGLNSGYKSEFNDYRRPHQPAFDQLFDCAREFVVVAGYANHLDQNAHVPVSICYAQQLETFDLEEHVDDLEAQLVDE